MIRIFLAVFVVCVVGFVVWRIMLDLAGLMTIMSFYLSALVIFLALGFGAWWLLMGNKKIAFDFNKKKVDNKNMMLHQTGAKAVYVFREQPSLADVIKLEDEMHKTKLELYGDIFQVDNDTHVIVLEDTGKETVKVKLTSADKKARDKEGWVCRSVLIRPDRTLPGR